MSTAVDRGLTLALSALALWGCHRASEPAPSAPPDAQRQKVRLFWERFGDATAARIAGDCTRAIDLYFEAIRLDPRHEDSFYYLGQCQRITRQPAEARRAFERLVEVNPASARGHLALGALLASAEPTEPLDLAQAESHLRRAHEINGEETGPMLRLGEVLLVQDRVADARTWLEAAARTNPRAVEASFLLAYLAWDAGDRGNAHAHFVRALKAAQADAPPKGVLGEGDRKVAVAGQVRAAPPLQEPMGRTLFSDLARPLRGPEAASIAARPESLYRAVEAARRAVGSRRTSAASAVPGGVR
jgi:tetratricopeptide (TPR) repeat protein